MIRFDQVSIAYEEAPVLRDVDFTLAEGELTLVVGETGSGKSTLIRAINGLVPHFTGGTLTGRVTVAGRDTATHRPRDLADVVGFVSQDPLSSFVTDRVEDELAYGLEALGVSAPVMRRRVEETLDLLGIADLRARPLRTLSSGQQQRVAIAAVLAAGSRVLVLDEPTSALDPVAAEDVLAALHRLVHDVALTVVVAEHRLERAIHHADRMVIVADGTATPPLEPAAAMAISPIFPPVVALGRELGWSPLPLSVRDARRAAADLRESLPPPPSAEPAVGDPVAQATGLAVRRGKRPVLTGIDLTVRAGEVACLMGRNGAGKSTLLAALVGQHNAEAGTVRLGPLDVGGASPAEIVKRAGMVPADPTAILYSDRVADECAAADKDFGLAPGTVRASVERVVPGIDDDAHPRDLSEGQRLGLALGIVLASRPTAILLDEPTRGLDYSAKHRLVEVLRELVADGSGVLLATHDVELAAEVADRVVLLGDGEVVADGPARDLLAGSLGFAPQVAKVLHPHAYLTVAEVAQ